MDFKVFCVAVLLAYLSGRGNCGKMHVIPVSVKPTHSKEGQSGTTQPNSSSVSPSTEAVAVSNSTLVPWWKTTPAESVPLVLAPNNPNAATALPYLRKLPANQSYQSPSADNNHARDHPKGPTTWPPECAKLTAKPVKPKKKSSARRHDLDWFNFSGKPFNYHFNYSGPLTLLMKKR